MTNEAADLTQLGHRALMPASPDAAKLERVPNPHADTNFATRFVAPEFTSLCPVTGQPDFAHLVIDYVPDQWLVESKSLKLFLTSFRNHGAFHEDCTVYIGKRLTAELQPRWLRIGGYWYPRGGIQSTCSGNTVHCRSTYGFPTRVCRLTGDAGNREPASSCSAPPGWGSASGKDWC